MWKLEDARLVGALPGVCSCVLLLGCWWCPRRALSNLRVHRTAPDGDRPRKLGAAWLAGACWIAGNVVLWVW